MTLHRRVVVDHIRPLVDGGSLPAKAAVGVPVEISADLVADGHDLLMGAVRHRRAGTRGRGCEVPLRPLGNDRWAALLDCDTVGRWEFEIVALPDEYGTWERDLRRRHQAGQELGLELEVGARLADAAAARPGVGDADAEALAALGRRLRDGGVAVDARVGAAGAGAALALMRRTAGWGTPAATVAGPFPLWVDRPLAAFSAWYELFPRSEGAAPPRSGTFASAAQRLPAIAAMGFDIVYLPPIHPIGHTNRKGRNNTLEPEPGDPGSPWAIGSEAGGHTAVHPDLGSLADFDAFVAAARENGLEVALDFAIQCSPDHPWVGEHPEWFDHLPDGSIRFAENPPKRYQDIYPVDFGTPDRAALEAALIEVVLFWAGRGVRVFRVDNPHTKPLLFWQRLIDQVRRRHPDTLFLSEAFTRPRVMERLAKAGFTQSYTYFTWRNRRWELEEYLRELSQTEMADWFRPCFWPNTPDILHETLQRGGPPAFRLRAVLAALCAPSWGIYSGYELCENVALREGSEEYLDSEKYQYRPRDWSAPHSLAPFIARLNGIRRRHRAAVAALRTLRIHHVDGDELLAVSRSDDAGDDVLLVIANLDPLGAHDGFTWLDLGALGIDGAQPYEAHDELTDTTYVWQGPRNYVRLDPAVQPAHVFHLRAR